MDLPHELQRWLEHARLVLDRLDSIEEVARLRFAVYEFFAALPGLEGRMARTYLGVKATQRVLPLWERWGAEFGYETMPELMLGAAERMFAAMKEGATPADLDTLTRTLTVEVDSGTKSKPRERYVKTLDSLEGLACEMDSLTGESPDSHYWLDWCVFLTALNTLAVALGAKLPFDTAKIESNKWGGDPARWAAIAYGGGRWSPLGPPAEYPSYGIWDFSAPEVSARRLKFWRWWLLEVVPETYCMLYE